MVFGDAPEPSPAQGDIRVAVHAVGLNPVDYKIARMGHPDWGFPHILGLDVAGVVDAIGASVTHWRPGDRVFYHGDLSKPGGLAEFAVTTAHTVARIPNGMSFVDAASLPCAGLTAYHTLHRRLHVRAGQSILVHAGAGGVGGFAIQLAAHAGLKVLTTCSANNADYVRGLGADVAIDYHTGNLKEVVRAATDGRGVDAILSSLGSERATQDLDRLAFNGGLACLLGLPDLTHLQPFTIAPSIHEVALGSAHLSGDKRAQDDLARMADELAALMIQGSVRLRVVEVIPWPEISAGLDRLADGHVRGKIVTQVRTN
jgi:NADPH:quinone reductase-like Zn-dependent oxidoreductase